MPCCAGIKVAHTLLEPSLEMAWCTAALAASTRDDEALRATVCKELSRGEPYAGRD
jgi:hypothetical protein